MIKSEVSSRVTSWRNVADSPLPRASSAAALSPTGRKGPAALGAPADARPADSTDPARIIAAAIDKPCIGTSAFPRGVTMRRRPEPTLENGWESHWILIGSDEGHLWPLYTRR